MPLAAALLATLTGFLLPWRFEIPWETRTVWMSAGDMAIASGFIAAALLAPSRVIRAGVSVLTPDRALPAAVLVTLCLVHAALTPAAGGGGALPALATAAAILGGFVLAAFDRTALFAGLAAGVLASAAIAFAILPFRPDLVLEHTDFAGLAGTKNTFAFLAAAAALRSVEAAARRGGRARTLHLLVAVACAVLVMAANARAAMVALGAGLLIVPAPDAMARRLKALVALLGMSLLAGAAVPWDRIWFAWAILVHAQSIPLLGLGPGYGYGLDTFLKLLLELGPIGGLAAASLVLGALRRHALTPALALVLVIALAHDAARWPLFWMVIFDRSRVHGGQAPSFLEFVHSSRCDSNSHIFKP